MDAKEKIQALLETSKDGTVTAAQVSAAGLHRSILQELVERTTHGKMISTYCSSSMDEEFTHTIQHCICWAIRTVPRQNIQ